MLLFLVVINEIAWMGTAASPNDEWIELYNNTNSAITIDGWTLKAADGAPSIALTGTIPPNSFFLIERTDDNSVPEVPADQYYSGALNNKGEIIELHNSAGGLIDSIDCGPGWPAGDNKTKQTMERNLNGWQTSQNPGGTPKAKNSVIKTEALSSRPVEPAKNDAIEVNPAKTEAEKNLAAVGKQTPKTSAPLFTLFISLIVAIFSGITILTLKKLLKQKN